MGALELFTALVLAVGVFQLADRLATVARNRASASRRRNIAKRLPRSDWYVFFSCSSLYGKGRNNVQVTSLDMRRSRQGGVAEKPKSFRSRPRITAG